MTIRVTHIYRPIDAEWCFVHRHADFPPSDQRTPIRAPPDQAALDVCSWWDCVEKLENRVASKFSQMSHVAEFSHCKAL
jgi:hypothetical protein